MFSFLDKLWYGEHPLQWLLRPLSWGYQIVVSVRRYFLQRFCQVSCPVPLIIVGNITVGGVGKTPLVIELAKKMQEKGLRVGIVSRGYGATIKQFPYEVQVNDSALKVGDEPLLLAQRAKCPVVIAPKRTQAVNYLLKKYQSEIIISDDGLQHYCMGRAIEIAVIDGTRGLGNGFCLPAGPLREPASRLKQVDFIVVNEGSMENAYSMSLRPGKIKKLNTDEEITPETLQGVWEAVAAIGNPQRFYSTLQKLGIEFNTCSYPDHYQFRPEDLNYIESLIIMTEKDAVKCRSFSSDRMHYLPVDAVLDDAFWKALWLHQQLKGYC
ncbi:tetraacyldisaccharide 4'-kinase [Legionella longbeachae]|uniref:Tetraacyldisaccharide 4'-kinase n=1 Tax=Legionella longbeachae serogroup 1 (strain NSW150) TaxID=661367 RepID=D3HRB0_LEGLN|nr:tetraacyldisaccharide 4'-kinase [Legionella longbeachae]VEE01946.1 tetraacyldisaccharide 4'-kinase [Legionella oakridgensis]HBD7396802.1 tetraacyldisaccharide 4'-kinase [Legionella pneumophila]ARB91739.1 tetraacyldisaccharide 4'-kinase [Legionella longbeachae]QIN35183.1 tetraacyldisaccharide 4'-kinase [Legionella longbeachae]RZV28114.1 tetraacyldisaccharide 4'-kinase [Legionella longbeachae]